MAVFAIDPGPVQSAYVLWDGEAVLSKGLVQNNQLLEEISTLPSYTDMVIESITSYGMPVGATVFDTCIYIGCFIERWGGPVRLIPRREVKLHMCGSMKAKDSNIRQALVDRFARGFPNYGKGNKANPSIFYGFKKDVWAAMALAVTAFDTINDKGHRIWAEEPEG